MNKSYAKLSISYLFKICLFNSDINKDYGVVLFFVMELNYRYESYNICVLS